MEISEIKKIGQLQQWVAEQYNNLDSWEQAPGTSQMRTADVAGMLKTIGNSLDDLLRDAGALAEPTAE